MFRTIAACSLAFTLSLTAAAAELTQLDFGIIATESQAGLKKDFAPLAEDLGKAVGMPVNLFVASDYSGVIEAMRFNKVQIGWFGNKSAIDAVDRAGGEVFGQVIDKDGNPGYWSLIIVNKDSPLQTLEQLIAAAKDTTFSMGDPQSTSGTLIPGYFAFARNGVDPQKAFKAVRNGNHESNALAVASKQVDAATFNTEAMFRLQASNPEKAALIRPIWKSGLIASDPLVWKADLAPEVKTKIRDFFVGYGKTEEQKARIAALKWSGFKASSNDQLVPYRHLSLLKDQAKLEADDKIPASDKQAKLDVLQIRIKEIEAQLAALDAKQVK